MRNVILGLLLMHGPQSLYDLIRRFGEGVSLFYSASPGSIQSAMKSLVDAGLVDVTTSRTGRRQRHVHRITDAGTQAWHEWMHSPIVGRDAETVMLARVFFLGLVPAEQRSRVTEIMLRRVDDDLAALTSVASQIDATEVPVPAADAHRYARATLEYGIRAHELVRTWLVNLG